VKPLWAPENPSALHPKRCHPNPTAGVFVTKAETLEQFLQELKGLQVIECRSYGCGSQNQRTIYQPIGCVYIYEDAHMPWNPFRESRVHWWTGDYLTKKQAVQAVKRFDCFEAEAPYPDEGSPNDRMLYFNTFESCATWVWVYRKRSFMDREHPYMVVTMDGDKPVGAYTVFSQHAGLHTLPRKDKRVFWLQGRSLEDNQRLLLLEDATPELKELAVRLAAAEVV